MTTMPAVCQVDHWHEAVDLAGLHLCRSGEDLDRELACKLVRLLPATDMALCMPGPQKGTHVAQMVVGGGCPFTMGDPIDPAAWLLPQGRRYPIRYRNLELGILLLDAQPTTEQERVLTAMLAHYGVALVNLTLNEEGRQATDHYCASLQALEEGIVLFQESDHEAISARLIGLATTMIQATAGALYVLSEVGKLDSGLVLTQTLGIPEMLLQGFQGQDGKEWPRCLLDRPAFIAYREEDPGLGGLDPTGLPEILTNLVAMPLRYHGIVAGVCVLFNVNASPKDSKQQLERLSSLGQLGAALLHRLSLEAASVRNREIMTQLAIAETIQRRLLPRKAPAVAGLDFAWRSIAAQNIGGDYLDLLQTETGEICGLIADASGHGINSALLMSSFRSTYRAEAPRTAPAELLGRLNSAVHDEVGATGMFITAVTLRMCPTSRSMVVASAGHNPTLIYRAATGAFDQVDSHGPPLGFVDGADYESETTTLNAGDIMVLYTDGVTEATDRELDMFEEGRLAAAVKANAGQPSAAILDAVLASLKQFTGRTSYDDDVSISVIKAV